MEFKELTKGDAERSLAIELEKLKKTGNLPELQAQMIDKEFGGFQRLFNKFLAADSGSAIEWERIEKLPSDAMLDKLVVVKLNGGLGTSMGCKGPKSVIPVRSDLTFLDLTVQQIEHLNKKYDTDVP